MKLEPQIKELCRQLRQELECFPAGSRFYSVRELADKYKCHRRILDAALDELEQQQLISRVPRVGIFSNLASKHCKRRVLVALPDWPGEIIKEWWACAQNYAQHHPNWILHKTLIPVDQRIDSLNLSGYDCAIIHIPDARITIEDMGHISAWQIPAVFFNIAAGSVQINNVGSDDAHGSMQVCKYLFDHGHRKTAVLVGEPHTYTTMERLISYRQAAQLLGMKTVVIDCDTKSGEFAPQSAKTAVQKYLADHDGKIDFTAIFTVTGEIVPGAMQALREYGYHLPEDVSIISLTSEKIGEFYHPPLTAVCADLYAEIAAAFEGLQKILDGEIARFRACIPMKLVERNSVKTLTNPQGVIK